MKDLIITINTNTRKARTTKNFIGINGENLNGNIIIDFESEFIDGVGYLEIDNGENKYVIGMTKDGEHYTVPIKSSLLTKTTKLKVQFRAHIAIDQDTTRIFKSEIIELPVLEAINATADIPDDYPAVWVYSIGGATGDITLGNGLTIENGVLSATGGSGGGIDPSILTAKGSLISSSNAETPIEVAKGTDGQVLTMENDMPTWKTPTTPAVTANDIDSGSTTQYEVLKADGNGGATWGRVNAGDIADNNQVGQILKSTGYGFAGWGKFEVGSGQINSGGVVAGKVLTSDGNNGASWESTLNKYTLNISTWNNSAQNKIKNILTTAKGNVFGHIQLRWNVAGGNKNFNLNIKEFICDDNYTQYLLINCPQACNDGTNQYNFLICVYSYSGTWTNGGCLLLKQDGTITNITATPTFMNAYIQYFNDTEI